MYHRFRPKGFLLVLTWGGRMKIALILPQTMPLIGRVSVLCTNSVDFADFSCHITKMFGRGQTNHL